MIADQGQRPNDDASTLVVRPTAFDLPASLAPLVRHWPEVAVWTGVVLAAGVLRLAALGDAPLTSDEAVPALEAWRLWLGHPPRDLDSAALLAHLLTVTFGLLGASDVVARLPSALAGLALVVAPLLLRGALGPVGALGAGALFALSPLLVFASRRVDPAILVAALLALLVGACAQALTAARTAEASPPGEAAAAARGWAYAAPVLAALLLATGSVAVPAALAVAGAAALTWWPLHWPTRTPRGEAGGTARGDGARGTEARDAAAEEPSGEAARRWVALVRRPSTLILFVATLVLASTAGLSHLRGLQAGLADPWVSWLVPYHPRPVPIPWLPTLLLYDLPLVLAALAGLVLVARRNRPFDHFLLWWAALAAVPLVFQPSDPVPYLVLWAVPLGLLGGTAIAALGELGWTWSTAGRSALLLALLAADAFFAVNVLRFVIAGVTGARPGGLGGGVRELASYGLILLFLGIVHARLASWWRSESPLRAAALGALAVALVFVLATNGRLSFANYGAGGAELLRPEVLAPEVHELTTELQLWARQEPNVPITVSSALRPSLLWHLRDVPTVQFVERRPAGLIGRGLWPADGPDAPDGERRPLRETIVPAALPSSGALWNWWLYRNSWLVPNRDDIIVIR